jgi:nuclear transport factor 2 (NTF2) superfamily protein
MRIRHIHACTNDKFGISHIHAFTDGKWAWQEYGNEVLEFQMEGHVCLKHQEIQIPWQVDLREMEFGYSTKAMCQIFC